MTPPSPPAHLCTCAEPSCKNISIKGENLVGNYANKIVRKVFACSRKICIFLMRNKLHKKIGIILRLRCRLRARPPRLPVNVMKTA